MNSPNISIASEAGSRANEDRYCVLETPCGTMLAVADGAGGIGGGAEAAERLTTLLTEKSSEIFDQHSCGNLLTVLDRVLSHQGFGGETTCVLTVVGKTHIFGASVGDSGVWFIPPVGNHHDLSSAQVRKPLIGSGAATPRSFVFPKDDGVLLLATDGLLKYAKAQKIIEACQNRTSLVDAAFVLSLARMPNGNLQDDTTVLLARVLQ